MNKASTILLTGILAFGSANFTGCGYNSLQVQDEQVGASWAEVLNQYKRRADLVPSLVEVVKGYAKHEEGVLTEVVAARASATSIQASPELVNDPEAFKKFIAAQDQLKGSLSRLMAVTENYPDLKANVNFQNLSAQLEGTENRIAVARGRYIESITAYNSTVRRFPSNLTAKMFGLKVKPQFTVDEATVAAPPTVKF